MRVLLISCVFPPEPVVSGKTSVHIAQELVKRGHTVTVITSFPSKPAGKLYPGYSRRLLTREQAPEGFVLIRCFSFLSSKSNLSNRFMENLSFGLTSGVAVLFSMRPDVIYSNSWPVFATGVLFIVAKMRRIPFVISVQDVYPESLVSQGRVVSKNLFMNWLRWWDGVIARGSRAVIVISERFADLYREGRQVPKERVHVVPNWGDEQVENIDAGRIIQFKKAKNIPENARVFVYGGNIGVAAGVETLVEAALKVQTAEVFRLLIAGAGSQLQACKDLAQGQVEGRAIFHSPWYPEETDLMLNLAEVLLLPTRGRQAYVSVPSKLISYWLAGKPVIALALPQSTLADFVEQSGGGWLVEADRPDLLAAMIQEVLGLSPAELRRRGEAGRDFAVRNLTRGICLPRVVNILEQVAVK
jgi:glycosyltransferase involved in cell wall biosynthesis